MSIDIENEEMIQRLENSTGPATDPHHLAELIKKELREVLDGSRKFKAGDEPLDRDKITTRMVRVKQKDFSSTDFEEMISLVRQMKNFLEEKNKQDRQRTENIKLNNPHLFTHGKRNGHNYTIYVPDNHIALTNCTNSEKQEIISEAEAQRLEQQGKGNFIKYETYVELNDKIFIDHYQENGQQELVNPVSGVNGLIENTNDKNMSVGLISEGEKENSELDKEGLLKIFQKYKRLNQSEFKKVIGYCQTSGQTSLSQQELNNLLNTATPRNSNNTLLMATKKAQELQRKMEKEGIFGVMNDPKLRKQMEELQKRFGGKIPKGQVSTYKYIADFLRISPREVGRILKNNPFSPDE
ncbi:24819_t:CDS:2, partial [Racocetra persica]